MSAQPNCQCRCHEPGPITDEHVPLMRQLAATRDLDLDAIAAAADVDLGNLDRAAFDRLGEALGRRMGVAKVTVEPTRVG